MIINKANETLVCNDNVWNVKQRSKWDISLQSEYV